MLVVGAPLPPPEDTGLPADPDALAAYGYGQLVSAVIVVPIAVWVYRQIIVKWCEGRSSVPELAVTPHAKKWIGVGALMSAAVIVVALVAVVGGGGAITSAPTTCCSQGWPVPWGLSFAGVVEELFARGTLFRHLGAACGVAGGVAPHRCDLRRPARGQPQRHGGIDTGGRAGGRIMLAAVYMVARTLWAVFAVHFAWNFGQSVLGLPVSGNEQLSVL